MKRAVIISALMLFFAGQSRAQFERGRSEVSFLGSMGSYTYKQSTSGVYSSFSQSVQYLSFSTTYGYYVADGFSIEPDVTMTFMKRVEPGFQLIANVSYTQRLPNSIMALFGRIGYGLANSEEFPMYPGAVGNVTNGLKVGVFNAGVGTKILVSKCALVRLELNYRSQSWSNVRYYPGDNTISNIGLLTGLSLLF